MKDTLSGSLRLKLVGIVLATTLAAVIVALAAIVVFDIRAYEKNWRADIGTQAELLGLASQSAIAFDDPRTALENLQLLRLRPHVQAAAIYTARGDLFASYLRKDEKGEFPKLPEADGMHVSNGSLVVYRRIADGHEILGTVYLRADHEIMQRIYDYIGIAAIVTLFAMLVAVLMSSRLLRIVTRPILDIAGIAREVVDGRDYSRRATKYDEDEVGMLVDSFNRMLDEIERRTRDLEAINDKLGHEVEGHARAERENLRLNNELEARVLERTAQLESANRELEAFSFSVSHDLRAPLRHIQGYAQMVQEDAHDLDPETRRYLDLIRERTHRMGMLIDDLLALSRLSRRAIEPTMIDMNVLVERVVADLGAGGSDDKRMRISRLPPVEGDLSLLQQVWINLLSNAMKYSANRGEAARVDVSGERDGDIARYRVIDNGVGFDMRYADKLFGVFQRLHSQDQFEGTGVGLAIVQRIVTRHGGRVWADAEPDRGATFTFELPATPSTPAESAT